LILWFLYSNAHTLLTCCLKCNYLKKSSLTAQSTNVLTVAG
jgi:hypothetical protein